MEAIRVKPEEIKRELDSIFHYFDYIRSQGLSVRAIERLSEVPKNTLLNFLSINRPIPEKHLFKIVSTLEHFGYSAKLDWSWVMSPLNKTVVTTE